MDDLRAVYYRDKIFTTAPKIKRYINETYPELIPNLTIRQIQQFLDRQEIYQLHKQPKKPPTKFKMIRRIESLTHYQADLTFLLHLSRFNRNYKYLLTVINVTTKRGYVEPLKTKNPREVIEAFRRIQQEGANIQYLRSDRGSEFISQESRNYFAEEGISFSTTDNHAHAVESFNKTFKQLLTKYMEAYNTRFYIDAIPSIVDIYNKLYKRDVREFFKNPPKSLKNFPELEVGDEVRLKRKKALWEKGYTPKWTTELYKIQKVIHPDNIYLYTRYLLDPIDEGDPDIFQLYFPWDLQYVPIVEYSPYRLQRENIRNSIYREEPRTPRNQDNRPIADRLRTRTRAFRQHINQPNPPEFQ